MFLSHYVSLSHFVCFFLSVVYQEIVVEEQVRVKVLARAIVGSCLPRSLAVAERIAPRVGMNPNPCVVRVIEQLAKPADEGTTKLARFIQEKSDDKTHLK